MQYIIEKKFTDNITNIHFKDGSLNIQYNGLISMTGPVSDIKELILTDSIQATEEAKNAKNIRHISVAPLMGEAIKRINSNSSVSALFD